MKKKYLMLGVAAVLVSAAIIGGSLATINAVGEAATNRLGAPTLSVDIGSASSAKAAVDNPTDKIMPGDSLNCSGFEVKNTAQVPLYARVTVTKYWTVDGEKNTELDAKLIEMTVDKSGWLQADQVMVGSSGETEVYYLAKPLASGESATLDLGITVSENLNNLGQNAGITVKATVDAVQFVAGQNELNANGILASFGVIAALDGNGSITSVTQ